ncbi:hypothetical protein [Herbaspirillum sp. ST 5-3]|uniref:hypothetical protein n=1 Tax=Oxalobacteraceae TaxID=75682 RepID=UPI0010A52FB6|nr:hypothetical protein [Herbaspirillum sp. ST 5-3]
MTSISSTRFLLCGLLLCTLSHLSFAESVLTEAEIKSKYQNCSDGYYSGPRPGKTHYTKDDYLWVVSPEFASKYCMPPEFVDANLKGAEAVAFHLLQEGAEQCGYGGNKENCSRRIALGFEIYYKKDLTLPAISDTKYSVGALYMLPVSKHLLSNNLPYSVTRKDTGSTWSNERPGFQTKFKQSSFGLVGVKGDRVVWPITALGEFMYIEELLPGYNFISLEGNIGFFTNPRMEKQGVNKFVLVLRKPEVQGSNGRLLSEFAHVIELPEWFTEKVRAADKLKSSGWKQLIQHTLPTQSK